MQALLADGVPRTFGHIVLELSYNEYTADVAFATVADDALWARLLNTRLRRLCCFAGAIRMSSKCSCTQPRKPHFIRTNVSNSSCVNDQYGGALVGGPYPIV